MRLYYTVCGWDAALLFCELLGRPYEGCRGWHVACALSGIWYENSEVGKSNSCESPKSSRSEILADRIQASFASYKPSMTNSPPFQPPLSIQSRIEASLPIRHVHEIMLQTRILSNARSTAHSYGRQELTTLTPCAARPYSSIASRQPPHLLRHVAIQHMSMSGLRCAWQDSLTQLRNPLRSSNPLSLSSRLCLSRFYATRTTPNYNAIISSPESSTPRHLYSRARRKRPKVQYRSKTSLEGGRTRASQKKTSTDGKTTKAGAGEAASGAGSQPKHMTDRLPSIPRFHRPTREELLGAATGFWSRMRVRFKWLTIRSVRPFNSDDISAFFSWILLGHVIWIVVGTTTFFSLLILAVNTVFAQETLARSIGNYLTSSSGVKVVFESAIVPRWKDGVITFKNVFVSRRPGQQRSDVRKGSQTAAAAAAAELASERGLSDNEETNYTQYDLSIETVNVTLSFTKWFNGHGLLRDVEVSGVRGVLDRTAVHWSTDDVGKDPRSYRHEHNTGDFELESFKMDDLLISVYQPNNFRPFSVSIFSADLPRLRKQWLFYDFLSANHMSGSFDDSLFTIHPRQTHNYTGAQLSGRENDINNSVGNTSTPESQQPRWDKQSRIRIDGLKIDHLNRGVEGPFSWIHEGNVDIVADVMFPADHHDGIAKVVSDFYDRVEAQVMHARVQPDRNPTSLTPQPNPIEAGMISNRASPLGSNNNREIKQGGATTPPTLTPTPPSALSPETSDPSTATPPVILDLSVTLTSVHASIPLFTPHISYINAALIRPIVAYINTHSSASTPLNRKPHIPIHCRVVKPMGDFEGSWTVFDSGLLRDLERECYEAFVRGVHEGESVRRRVRKVGLWGLGVVVQALVLGLAGQVA